MARRALLFGLNYEDDPTAKLAGCINDTVNLKNLLVDKLGYKNHEVQVCTDQSPVRPTRSDMLRLIHELVLFTHRQKVEQIFIGYAGHGVAREDTNGDEKDNSADSCWVPLDYKKSGVIVDDDLGNLFRQVHPDTDVIVVSDSCHSGSITDSTYRYAGDQQWTKEHDSGIKCRLIEISGCREDQTAQEAWSMLDDRKIAGAMTSCLIKSLGELHYEVTLFNLLAHMRQSLSQMGFTQIPQICSSRPLGHTSVLVTAPQNARPFFVLPTDP